MENNKLVFVRSLGSLYPNKNSKKKRSYAIYRCYCGEEFKTQRTLVNTGHTKSCGCYQIKRAKESNTTHNGCSDKLYYVWVMMKDRCFNKKSASFKHYGYRGITVCEDWNKSYEKFKKWALENGYTNGLSIDRIDNDGNYDPSNCRFTDNFVQRRNTKIIRKNNTSGYRGVSYHRRNKNFTANIRVSGKAIYLGSFKYARDAAIEYNRYIDENKLEHTKNILSKD